MMILVWERTFLLKRKIDEGKQKMCTRERGNDITVWKQNNLNTESGESLLKHKAKLKNRLMMIKEP